METIKVLSPVQDKKIREDLNGSPIWKQSYHDYELVIAEKNHAELYEYSIKFDGVKPVQVTGVKKLAR
jgi:hypothetical protein